MIAEVFGPLAKDPSAFGLGDDAAIIPPRADMDLVVTTDAMVQGVHFLGEDGGAVAQRLLRVNLSDLAAMGADPAAYTLTVALNQDTPDRWINAFAGGLSKDQNRFGLSLIGGDTVAAGDANKWFSVTMFGHVKSGTALRRNGARPGDTVFVSGAIGDAMIGHQIGQGRFSGIDAESSEFLRDRFWCPSPRIKLGRKLHGLAHSAIDVSDGLIGDLGHICEQSGLGADIQADLVPQSGAAKRALPFDPDFGDLWLTWGDDYELVFTADPLAHADIQALASDLGVPLTAIGTITEEAGVRILDAKGGQIHFANSGYQHF